MADAPEVSPRTLVAALAQRGPLVLLDVREPFERAFCAIPVHASVVDLHVPVGQIQARLGWLRGECAGHPVVVYCHHGVRSRMVVDWLARQGFTGLQNLAGGVDAWSRDVDPKLPRY